MNSPPPSIEAKTPLNKNALNHTTTSGVSTTTKQDNENQIQADSESQKNSIPNVAPPPSSTSKPTPPSPAQKKTQNSTKPQQLFSWKTYNLTSHRKPVQFQYCGNSSFYKIDSFTRMYTKLTVDEFHKQLFKFQPVPQNTPIKKTPFMDTITKDGIDLGPIYSFTKFFNPIMNTVSKPIFINRSICKFLFQYSVQSKSFGSFEHFLFRTKDLMFCCAYNKNVGIETSHFVQQNLFPRQYNSDRFFSVVHNSLGSFNLFSPVEIPGSYNNEFVQLKTRDHRNSAKPLHSLQYQLHCIISNINRLVVSNISRDGTKILNASCIPMTEFPSKTLSNRGWSSLELILDTLWKHTSFQPVPVPTPASNQTKAPVIDQNIGKDIENQLVKTYLVKYKPNNFQISEFPQPFSVHHHATAEIHRALQPVSKTSQDLGCYDW